MKKTCKVCLALVLVLTLALSPLSALAADNVGELELGSFGEMSGAVPTTEPGEDPDALPAPTPTTELGEDPDALPAPTPTTELGEDSDALPAPTPTTELGEDPDAVPAPTPTTGLGEDSDVLPAPTPESTAPVCTGTDDCQATEHSDACPLSLKISAMSNGNVDLTASRAAVYSDTSGLVMAGNVEHALTFLAKDNCTDRTIYIIGPVNWEGEIPEFSTWTEPVTIAGIQTITEKHPDLVLGEQTAPACIELNVDVLLGGPVTFENIDFYTLDEATIYANGRELVVADTVATAGAIDVYGGAMDPITGDTSIILNGGSYRDVFGGGRDSEIIGNTSVTIGSGVEVSNVYGGGRATEAESSAPVSGNTGVTLGGIASGNVCGGGLNAVVEGDATVLVESGATVGSETSSRVVTGGGWTDDKQTWGIAYVNGKTTVTIDGTVMGPVSGNREGQDPASRFEGELACEVIIGESGRVSSNNTAGVSAGTASPAGKTATLLGGTSLTVRGSVEKCTLRGGSYTKNGSAIIHGDTNVEVTGLAFWINGGGADGTTITGNTTVTMGANAGISEGNTLGTVYGGGGTIQGNVTVNFACTDAKMPYGIYGGASGKGSVIDGSTTINVLPGAMVKVLVAGSTRGAISNGDLIVNVDSAFVDTLMADGFNEGAPSTGKSEVHVTGASTIFYVIGCAETQWGATYTAKGAESINVYANDANAVIYYIWYDIDGVSLTSSTVKLSSTPTLRDYLNLRDVTDLSVDNSSHLIFTRSNVISGNYTGSADGAARMTLPAGKKLLAGGTVSGSTALTIDETTDAALLAQVYLVAQTAGSTGRVTWTDSKNPVRFDLTQNAQVFGTTPDNANLTLEELFTQTQKETGDQKWWLTVHSGGGTTPGGGGDDDGGGGGGNTGGDDDDDPRPPVTPVTPPEVEITEPEIPLGPAPVVPTLPPETDVVIIDPEEVPMGNLPQTGSNVNSRAAISFLCLALAGSATAAAGVYLSTKKKEN